MNHYYFSDVLWFYLCLVSCLIFNHLNLPFNSISWPGFKLFIVCTANITNKGCGLNEFICPPFIKFRFNYRSSEQRTSSDTVELLERISSSSREGVASEPTHSIKDKVPPALKQQHEGVETKGLTGEEN